MHSNLIATFRQHQGRQNITYWKKQWKDAERYRNMVWHRDQATRRESSDSGQRYAKRRDEEEQRKFRERVGTGTAGPYFTQVPHTASRRPTFTASPTTDHLLRKGFHDVQYTSWSEYHRNNRGESSHSRRDDRSEHRGRERSRGEQSPRETSSYRGGSVGTGRIDEKERRTRRMLASLPKWAHEVWDGRNI